MTQTDRQTDKAMIWACTAFNDEIELIKDKAKYPAFVKLVVGQDEICPDTGKKHFQGCIQLFTQQRLSALKKWLPTAHFEVCRNKDALLNYVNKDDTRDLSGERISNGARIEYIPFDKLNELLADTWIALEKDLKKLYVSRHPGEEKLFEDLWITSGDNEDWVRSEFKFLINYLILNGYSRQASAFADNRLKTFWIDTSRSWIKLRQAEKHSRPDELP